MVLVACGANRKAAADGMRAIIDESGGAVGWRATGSASTAINIDGHDGPSSTHFRYCVQVTGAEIVP
jgi:hypothetical protein